MGKYCLRKRGLGRRHGSAGNVAERIKAQILETDGCFADGVETVTGFEEVSPC